MSKRNKKRKDIQGFRQKQRKHQNEQTSHVMVKKYTWITVLLSLLLVLATGLCVWLLLPESPTSEEDANIQAAQTYLSQKYDAHFTYSETMIPGMYRFTNPQGQDISVYTKEFFSNNYDDYITEQIKDDFVDNGYFVLNDSKITEAFSRHMSTGILGQYKLMLYHEALFAPSDITLETPYAEFTQKYPGFAEPFLFVLTDQHLTDSQLKGITNEVETAGLPVRLRIMYATTSEQESAEMIRLMHGLASNPNLLWSENLHIEE